MGLPEALKPIRTKEERFIYDERHLGLTEVQIEQFSGSAAAALRAEAIEIVKIGILYGLQMQLPGMIHKAKRLYVGKIGLSYLRQAHFVAREFNYELDDFVKAFDTWEAKRKTFNGFYKFIGGKPTTKRYRESKSIEHSLESMKRYILKYRDDPERSPKIIESLKNVRATVNRLVPPVDGLLDGNYLQYYDCSGCGAYPPPPEGYHVVECGSVGPRMRYPMCPDCLREGKEPDYKKVADMYMNYAYNLEYATEVIGNMMNG